MVLPTYAASESGAARLDEPLTTIRSAGDAARMAELLEKQLLHQRQSETLTFRVAYRTTRLAFDILVNKEACRGLLWIALPDGTGEVFYDRDPTWQHECL